MRTTKATVAGLLACGLVTTAALAEPKTNMLHQWSEGADASAIAKLGEMFTAAGGKWEQTSIAGHTANTLAKLRADVIAGNAPPAVQLKGPEIAEWNATGMTANMDDLANKEGWDKVIKQTELLPVMKPTGNWVAAPMNIHRINWIWGSTKAMEQAGIKEMPKTWAEFNADCDKAVAAHLICLAHFSQDWTDATVFEVVLYGMDKGIFLRKPSSRPTRPRCVGRNGQGARAVPPDGVQIHGPGYRRTRLRHRDRNDREEPGCLHDHGGLADRHIHRRGAGLTQDYQCAQAPTDWGKPGFILNSGIDRLLQAKGSGLRGRRGVVSSSHTLTAVPDHFQSDERLDPGASRRRYFEGIQTVAAGLAKYMQASIADGMLVRSMAHNMTILQKYRGAIMEVITSFVNTPNMSAQDAANAMADAVDAQK